MDYSDYRCKLCQAFCAAEAFSDKQRKRLRAGKTGSCAGCQEDILALKRSAFAAQERSADGQLESVSADNWRFWQEGLAALPRGHEMLSRWLQKELRRSDSEADSARVGMAPAWLEELRAERVLAYDAVAYPFEQLFCAMFETSDLAGLHKAPLNQVPLCPTLLRAYHLAGLKRPKSWRQKEKWQKRYVQSFRRSAQYLCFLEVYHRFMLELVVPMLGHELLYQCPPTLRCQMPGVVPMGRPHRDSDFAAHHGAEINFWIPVTQVWGSNSLQTESAPGREDFHPLQLGPGELVVFNGSRCLHYTLPNETDSVRVSFDFRVIPKSLAGNWRHVVKSTTASELAQYEFICTEQQRDLLASRKEISHANGSKDSCSQAAAQNIITAR
ncbi:unnamed protein product [Effrenium voratum]|uniref:Uncharacterized protein n=1 Tax=Effrenium voratum TaxID=2562239 RepID=A0AA36MTW1_9DINO|nr:unnamed protein product [Effrenium voratum]CAJ1425065.1 unnamed protein product [Effrenium voratum]